jgi:hypothetical protein
MIRGLSTRSAASPNMPGAEVPDRPPSIRRQVFQTTDAVLEGKGGVMFHKLMSLILAGLLILNSSVFAAAAAEETGTVANLQAKARNAMDQHKQVVVITRSEKGGTKKFPGTISEVSDKGLTLVENKTGRTMAMSYQEIRDIKGKSVHWPIYVAIAGGAAAIVLGVMFHELSKD